jgi:hypothetical protein
MNLAMSMALGVALTVLIGFVHGYMAKMPVLSLIVYPTRERVILWSKDDDETENGKPRKRWVWRGAARTPLDLLISYTLAIVAVTTGNRHWMVSASIVACYYIAHKSAMIGIDFHARRRAAERAAAQAADESARSTLPENPLDGVELELVYCKFCNKSHAVTGDERPCAPDAWVN